MRIALLTLADAANTDADGKLNVLGAGVRLIGNPTGKPTIALAVVLQVDASASESGDYKVRLEIRAPSDATVLDVEMSGTVPGSTDHEVPTGFGVIVGVVRTFAESGIHVLRAVVGDLEPVEYPFKVLVGAVPTSEQG